MSAFVSSVGTHPIGRTRSDAPDRTHPIGRGSPVGGSRAGGGGGHASDGTRPIADVAAPGPTWAAPCVAGRSRSVVDRTEWRGGHARWHPDAPSCHVGTSP